MAGLALMGFASVAGALGGAPFDTCSSHIGDATLNEVHQHNNDGWVEVRLLDEELDEDTWQSWTVATSTGPDDGDEHDYSLGDATVDGAWLLLDVDKQALDLRQNGETEVALLDADGEYIDYLSVNGANHNEPGNCDDFLYDTDAVSSSQYKSLRRVPDGVGNWTSPSSPGAGGGTTPGSSNDGGDGSQVVDASSGAYKGDEAALYTRIVGRDFNLSVRYRVDEPEPREVTLDLVEDDGDGGCGDALAAGWASSNDFEDHQDGGYEVVFSGLSHDEAVTQARIRIELVVEAGGNPGGGNNAGPACGWLPFLPWCNSGGGGGNSGGGGQETTLEYCSSDAFTLRPAELSLSARNTAGEALTRGDWSGYAPTSCSAEACQAAAAGFILGVEAIPTGQGFDSDIQLATEAHPEAPAWMDPGTLDADLAFDGTTDSTEATGATYGEAGLVAVNAHDGGAFAAVDSDAGHCVAGATHNQPDDAGLVGCRTALPAAVPLGRFTPQEFALVEQRIVDRLARAEAGCVPAPTGFTYLGETLATEMTLEARNAAGVVTRHYRGAYASLGPADTADWSAIHAPGGAGRESLTDRLSRESGTTREGWAEGEVGRLSLRIPLTVDRATDPEGPWTDVRFGLTAADADGITLVADGLDASGDGTPDRALAGTTELRHGRLALASGHAAEFADLTLGIGSEYWVSATDNFRTNTEDDCTPLRDAGGSRLRYRSAPAGEAFGDWGEAPTLGETSATVDPAATVNGGGATLSLTAPREAGRVEVCLDLTGLDYLDYAWTEPADGLPTACAGSPVGRATFGVSQGSEDVLFTREVFR